MDCDLVKPRLDEMFVDDAVDFLEELPAGLVRRILQFTDRARRETINQILRSMQDKAEARRPFGVRLRRAMQRHAPWKAAWRAY